MKVELVLCVDIGNTRLKWGVCELADINFLDTGVVENIKDISRGDLNHFFSGLEPMPVWISSVASRELVTCLSDWFKDNWGLGVNDVEDQLKHYKSLNGYQKPLDLGVGR